MAQARSPCGGGHAVGAQAGPTAITPGPARGRLHGGASGDRDPVQLRLRSTLSSAPGAKPMEVRSVLRAASMTHWTAWPSPKSGRRGRSSRMASTNNRGPTDCFAKMLNGRPGRPARSSCQEPRVPRRMISPTAVPRAAAASTISSACGTGGPSSLCWSFR